MKTIATLSPPIQRNLGVLFTAGLLFWASMASLLPTLPLYIKDAGATNQQVGLVMGAFAIGLLLFRPWMGQMADDRGRKLVLLIGILAAALAPLGYLFTQSVGLLAAVRVFHGISIAAFTTAYSTLIVDLAPPNHRGEMIGYMSLVNPLGMAIGPALGGYLQEWTGYGLLFLVASGLGFGSLFCGSYLSAPPTQSQSPANTVPPKDVFWRVLLSDRIRIPTIVMLLIGLAFGTLATYVPLYIKSTGMSLNPGLFYTTAAISSFGVRLVTGRASDRQGRGRFVTIGLLCYAVSMLLLWLAEDQVSFLLAGFMEGAGGGIFIPVMVALVADRSHAHERGRIFALFIAGFDLGIALAGPILGVVADRLGYRGLFGVATFLTSLAVVIFLTLSSKDLKRSIKFALGYGEDLYALPREGITPAK